jgi:hypothetical protein
MENKEIALHLTLKAMEAGLISVKPSNHIRGDDPYEESTQHAIKQVSDFYRSMLEVINKGAN